MKQAQVDPPESLKIESSCIIEGDAHIVLATLVSARYMVAEACIDALEVSVLTHAGHANQHFRERSSTRPEQSLREDTAMLGFSAGTVPTGPRLERLDDVFIDVADDKIGQDESPVRVESDSDCNDSR